jgi:hypothetical protein
MNKKPSIIFLFAISILIVSNLASAYIIRDVQAEREAEWERYEQYKEDYIKFNDLAAFSDYIDERSLQNSFGFKPASYYYVPPSVLQAAYNPPLQGASYYTDSRGYTSSLSQPSAVQYFGEVVNGRYTGYIPSKLNGKYFDHPQMYGGQNYLINNYNYPSYSNYNSYGYSNNYDYGYGVQNYGYAYGSNQPAYTGVSFSGDIYGVYSNSGYGSYYSSYGYGDYQYLDAYDTNTGEPAAYARIVEPTTGGFYIIGYY